jgi:hypothetical protein
MDQERAMNFYVYDVNTNAVVSYARTLEEALSQAYGDAATDLDIAEMDHEEVDILEDEVLF